MFKNQLQELAQRSCFNLPSYTCFREGPDHAPRFKVKVNFNGETFESPSFCSTIRQAEYSAAEVALDALVNRGPSHSLAARILDETGVYKNLLQDISQRVGSLFPTYTTFRSGLGHMPVFTSVVELAGVRFTGKPAKNKKQAEKNAAMTAWTSLKQLIPQQSEHMSGRANRDEPEHVSVARALNTFVHKARMSRVQFPIIFPQNHKPPSTQENSTRTSRILPLIFSNDNNQEKPITRRQASFPQTQQLSMGNQGNQQSQNFPVIGTAPYRPFRLRTTTQHGIAPPVAVRNTVPVYSPPSKLRWTPATAATSSASPPACFRKLAPVFAAPPVKIEQYCPVSNGECKIGNDEGKKKETGDVAQKLQEMKI
ncbi:double-stranded RNA-binding protein 2-like [Impatiens glandulifera]|uniref:double-stranded RNA-binding protein 2-like n=1 Tax=Impatiens glandulifera TaxID=253017 RepID=UPI001FB0FD91|nr:double-stranded RNA-binding protein 2-like [Impatiens glandulifera]XP_047323882.1 double-stranded RNA-binding protein 2-like [Impatiens glandulifera]XP_047323883.1 double-stranded RNA-binding protein 2-like [Impatiens glandulifera]XP_047323884.1 double-stranded RNA-binding protein 2-like [Impatiens glandulifera]XP_047323885.1 double-stranded RNA-binding protein 2-like [Impatiens glandulifera]XP_047323886.1 double-stranded RNA-binding protein 2-like [Impatiens glandulifera]XP_047323887.1 do